MKKLVAILMMAALMAGFNLQTMAMGDDEDDRKDNNTTMTTSLKGQVVDESTGEALTGVKLMINGKDVSTYTDFDGHFTFQGLKPGEYAIETSFISYKNEIYNDVTLNLDEQNEVILKMKSIEE
ncbi:MAG: carboxypeptidase-like regulatory domain-containing protein [Bacteroidales bacterium]|nr:carboxypeptidase-like regulatory domain-containing protein [Bacteroidales bacterium]MBS3774149.1 carboxypeptidase-like regulatory domain-containing protein [Bacteroidales bacterium]